MHHKRLCNLSPLTQTGSATLDISNFLLYSYKGIHAISALILVANKPVDTVSMVRPKEGLKVKQIKLQPL